MRRNHKWSAGRIAFELSQTTHAVGRRTVIRHLAHLGLSRRRFIDPDGHTTRKPRTITARRPGHMVHIDVKKVGRIPDGGGWRAHGRNSDHSRAASRNKEKTSRGGYVYLHSAIDGHTRVAYTEPLPDEKASTAIAFLHRARAWFAVYGITRIERLVTDNGACCRADAFTRALLGSRHQRIRPYTPRHNGKWNGTTGSWPKSSCTRVPGPPKHGEPRCWRFGTSTTTATDPTPPPADNHPQQHSGRPSPTSCPHTASRR